MARALPRAKSGTLPQTRETSIWARNIEPSFLHQLWKDRVSYLFMAPFLIFFILFTIIPILYAIGLSFTHFNMLEAPRWAGWANYRELFVDDDVFLIALSNTARFALFTGPLGYILAYLMAWLISQIPKRFRLLYTLAFYVPSLTSVVVTGLIVSYFFSGDRYGFINNLLLQIGLTEEPLNFLTDRKYMMNVLIIVQLWMSMGTGFLAFIGGFTTIPQDTYEAGLVDGIRNRFQELWYITLPQMKPQLLFAAVLQVVAALAVADLSVALFGFPSANYAGHTILTHMSDFAFTRFEMGYASAVAVILFIVMFGLNKFLGNILSSEGE
ncbi:MAG: carbohydrate ABC transporter permease [Patescibacteria group bacterium]